MVGFYQAESSSLNGPGTLEYWHRHFWNLLSKILTLLCEQFLPIASICDFIALLNIVPPSSGRISTTPTLSFRELRYKWFVIHGMHGWGCSMVI